MFRKVDVPPQKVFGSVPLELPLIKMSDAEAIVMAGQPQIYDKDYPLDYSGSGLNPTWWRGSTSGTAGMTWPSSPRRMSSHGCAAMFSATILDF